MNCERKIITAACIMVLAATLFSACGGRGKIKLPVIKDTVAWMYRGEPTYDFGAAEPLFVEGAHYVALLGFDMRPAAGMRVLKARLWLHREGKAQLVQLVLSTISVDWIEGQGTGQGADPGGSSAAYVRIDPGTGKTVRWAGPGSDITDVIMSQGNTLRAECPVRQESAGWQSVEVPSPIIEALLNGDSYGLALVDGKGQLRDKDGSFIFKKFNSRDAGRFAPYLEVVLQEPLSAEGPNAPRRVELAAAPGIAGLASGALKVIVAPQGEGDKRGFLYEMVTSDKEMNKDDLGSLPCVPRYLLPHISQAAQDSVLIRDLPPQSRQYVAVRTVDCVGRKSDWVFARGFASDQAAMPRLEREKRQSLGGQIKVWACGPDEKVNPVNGRLLEENPGLYELEGESNYDYMYGNCLWSAAGSRVSLEAALGGTAAFHIVVEPERESLDGITVQANWVGNVPGHALSRFPVKVYKDWYIKSTKTGAWYPEVAVPLKDQEQFSIPDPANKIGRQRNQSVLVEFYVPRSARPGSYRGLVVVGARGLLSRRIEVNIEVHGVMLPEELPFVSELNVYGPVGGPYGLESSSDEYFEIEEKYYRAAHEHLCAINQLPYSQNGTVHTAGAPVLEGEGAGMRVADWSLWDKRFGRYLDGSAFESTDRRVPVPVMYLPFHENWPASLKKYYRFTPQDTSYIGMINEHALKAPPVEEAFDPAYEEAFVGVFRQFAEHFREKGWTRTEFQFYLNNKYYWKNKEPGRRGDGISWWLLDEPYHWDDFKALGYYGRLFMAAVGDVREVDFVYRLDISRPQLQFGLLDGLRSVTYSSAYFYEKNAFLRQRKEAFGNEMRNYGSFNDLEVSNLTTTAWPLKVYLNNGSGLLPWQTIGSDENFESFQNTAVLYPGLRFGIRGPVASLRLKAVRQGTEDVLLLDMLARREGWSREQAAVAVAGCVDLGGGTVTKFFDDAGQVSFGSLKPEDLSILRRALLRSLDR
ncbi:MAG TPA: hypothetical protein VM123_02220 [archaeon]|nr:hypothetical protein [archaeon]